MMTTGLKNCRFDSAQAAVDFAKRLGFKVEVEPVVQHEDTKGKKGYDNNFLNSYIKTRISKYPAKIVTKIQFDHPERGEQTWVNLGNLAVQMNTSTHYTNVDVKENDQQFWNSPDYSNNLPPNKYDTIEKATELRRKLGK